ncbi:hypothetical protein R3W88_011724 [Solanum pinnatisectum]|uniref:Uncharacterized protein n=1 Tax=Solanum pinnatisectum TaxID=50273 RepID=A0AAV9L722_9SOLN|nr:hypothetical protein R3W88_011724 [Solanum pinnatisectum]
MTVQHRALLDMIRLKILDIFPRVRKLIFRNHWNELIAIRKEVESVFKALIEAKMKYEVKRANSEVHQEEEKTSSYVDTLQNLEITEEKSKLTIEEIVTLCAKFLSTASDT